MTKLSGGNQLLDPYFILEQTALTEGMKVADLGCGGAGHFVFPAAYLVGKKGMVYAVDILKSALSRIENRAKSEGLINIKTIWANLEMDKGTKINEGELDAAFLINVLFQNQKHWEIIKEALRLIKSGGKLLIIEWKSSNIPLGPPLKLRLIKENLFKMSKDLGLKIEKEFEAGQYHYGLVFQKP